ncbi:MAG: DUF3817 domain-containing protein [Deltaproteobacteria bacterium]|nr:DUF3817 domain-containing protein [Deltaproteobacteria bacterium]
MLSSAIGRLRLVGLVEGTSYLLLLGVAMPLKYLGGMPMAVRIVGMAHGVLFVAFCFTLLAALVEHRWSLVRGAGYFVASLLPFGTFVIDGRLRREQAQLPK